MKQILVAVLLVLASDIAVAQGEPSGSQLCDQVDRLVATTRSRILQLLDEYDQAQRQVDSFLAEFEGLENLLTFVIAASDAEKRPWRRSAEGIEGSILSSIRIHGELAIVRAARDELAKKIHQRVTVLYALSTGGIVLCAEDDPANASTSAAGTPVRWDCKWRRGNVLPPYLAKFEAPPDDCHHECVRRPECTAYTPQGGYCFLSGRQTSFIVAPAGSGVAFVWHCIVQRNGGESR